MFSVQKNALKDAKRHFVFPILKEKHLALQVLINTLPGATIRKGILGILSDRTTIFNTIRNALKIATVVYQINYYWLKPFTIITHTDIFARYGNVGCVMCCIIAVRVVNCLLYDIISYTSNI